MKLHLQQATEALRQSYGIQPLPGEPGAWGTVVKLIVGRGLSADKLEKCWGDLAESPLATSRETEVASTAELQEVLEHLGRAGKSAVLLKSVAAWWNRHTDNETWAVPDNGMIGSSQIEELRDELRQISGLGLEQADRIMVFVANLPAYPLDRTSLRIAFRHGWLGPEADYEETQTFFVQGLNSDVRELEQFSLWSSKIGKEYCGPQPKCEGCPLQHLLPDGGPYQGDDL